jgi:hypothetical protein
MRKIIVLALVLALPAAAPAQGLRSVEANVGLTTGRGGTFDTRTGFAADALVSFGIRPHAGGMLVGALSAGASALPSGDRCLLLPGGGCMPDFPGIVPVAALVGWEVPGRVARLSAGPALVLTNDDGRKSSTGGVMGRVDLWTPSPFHLALVLSTRALVVPAYRGGAIAQLSIGVGAAIR